MIDQDRKLAWASVVVAVIISFELAWIIFIGPADRQPNYAVRCEKDCAGPWWWSSVVWTCIFTGLLTISSFVLWWETRRLARTGDRHHSQTQRAFIALGNCEVIECPTAPNTVRVVVKCINSGNTPTRRGVCHASWRHFPQGAPEDVGFPDLTGPGMTVGESQFAVGAHNDIIMENLDIPFAEFAKAGKVFAWGWVDYDDIFDGTPRHRMEFCWHVDAVQAAPNRIYFGLHLHRMFNGYDDECIHPPAKYVKPV